jgi:putative ABC transport system ATP-binding protein
MNGPADGAPGPAGAESPGSRSPTDGAIIRLDHVSRLYRMGEADVHALDDVSLTIDRGEFVAVMGPSGSGKSTLLNVLGCLDTPTSGRYLLDGEAVQGLTEDRLADIRQRKISFIFQTFHLVQRMTALRNVELPMIFAGVAPEERLDRAPAALPRVGLGPRLRHRPDELSGGERQRVAVARALVMEPSLLLADEPTGNLDSAAGRGIVDLLRTLHAQGLSIVLVTHDPSIAAAAGRVIRMQDGRVVSDRSGEGGADPGGRP